MFGADNGERVRVNNIDFNVSASCGDTVMPPIDGGDNDSVLSDGSTVSAIAFASFSTARDSAAMSIMPSFASFAPSSAGAGGVPHVVIVVEKAAFAAVSALTSACVAASSLIPGSNFLMNAACS